VLSGTPLNFVARRKKTSGCEADICFLADVHE